MNTSPILVAIVAAAAAALGTWFIMAHVTCIPFLQTCVVTH